MIFFSLFIVIGYAFCSAIFIDTPVYERENKLRYLLKVNGITTFTYWMGTFLTDFVLFLIPASCFILSVYLL
jgi:hypothetical protein